MNSLLLFSQYLSSHHYPIWHGAIPRPVPTFLESYDLSGKKLIPFNIHEGSGQSSTVSEIAASAPNAEMLEGIAIQGKVAQNAPARCLPIGCAKQD